MDSEGEVGWRESFLRILMVAVVGAVAHELVLQYFSPIIWIRKGDQSIALRVVEIVAVLLPLFAIFFQILFRRADDEESPLHERSEELIPPLMVAFFGLFTTAFFGTVVVMLGGIGVVLGFALFGLLGALSGLSLVVVTFATAVEDEYRSGTEQQELGESTSDVETESASGGGE